MTQRVVDAAAEGDSAPRVAARRCVIVISLFAGTRDQPLPAADARARRPSGSTATTLDFVSDTLLQLPLKYFETRRTADIERRLNGLRQVRHAARPGHRRRSHRP